MTNQNTQTVNITDNQRIALQAMTQNAGALDYQIPAYGFGPEGVSKEERISTITARSLVKRGFATVTRIKVIEGVDKTDQVKITEAGKAALSGGHVTNPAKKPDEIALCLLVAAGGSLDYQFGILGFGLPDSKKEDRIPLKTAESLIKKGLAVATRYKTVKGKEMIDRITYVERIEEK